jgi:hypothetical protein
VAELVLLGLKETADQEKGGVEENTAARKANARAGYHKLLQLRRGIKPVEKAETPSNNYGLPEPCFAELKKTERQSSRVE